MKRRTFSILTSLAATLALSTHSLAQAQPKPDELEREIQRRDSGSRGGEQAEREPGTARDRDRDIERERGAEHDPGRQEAMRRDMVRLRDQLQARLEEAAANGREGETAEIKEQLARWRRDMAALENEWAGGKEQTVRLGRDNVERRAQSRDEETRRGDRPGPGPRPEGLPGRPGGGPPPGLVGPGEAGDMHRRLHHLMVAIENLRLAGFPEPAETLEQQAEQMRRRLEGGGGEVRREERRIIVRDEPGPMPPLRELHVQMEHMRAEMEEMRRALKELQQQLKERP